MCVCMCVCVCVCMYMCVLCTEPTSWPEGPVWVCWIKCIDLPKGACRVLLVRLSLLCTAVSCSLNPYFLLHLCIVWCFFPRLHFPLSTSLPSPLHVFILFHFVPLFCLPLVPFLHQVLCLFSTLPLPLFYSPPLTWCFLLLLPCCFSPYSLTCLHPFHWLPPAPHLS